MLDLLTNFNAHISYFVNTMGIWFYVILFFIIFCETGSVLGIFFPGDSLLFTIGITAAATGLNIHLAVLAIFLGAVTGDTCNYLTGKFIGEKFFSTHAKFFRRSYLMKTKKFLNKHGSKAILFSRFIAFVRTLTPFVAGVSNMNYIKFVIFGIISAIIWSFSITYTVYFFSDTPIVKENLSLIIAIIILTVVGQAVIKNIRHKIKVKKS